MKRDSTRILFDETWLSPLEKKYETNKTMIKSIDDTWSSDLLDMNDYGPKTKSGYSYILVVIHNFGNFSWTILLKSKYAQWETDAFSQITNC